MGVRREREHNERLKRNLKMDIILVFGARSQTLRCANMLRASSYMASVTEAPLRIGGSCALAVSTDRRGLMFFTRSAGMFSSVMGAYEVRGGKYARIF